MSRRVSCWFLIVAWCGLSPLVGEATRHASAAPADVKPGEKPADKPAKTVGYPQREERTILGWNVRVSKSLLENDAAATKRALELMQAQLEEITRVVPKEAVVEMRKVTLWVSAEYPGVGPGAEYHPDAGWLREHGRDPAMARGVEFTNVRIFEQETRRMPNFTLHELAHAFHDRVLSFDEPRIIAVYKKAKASGSYDKVERRDAAGRVHRDKAYAMTDHKEYFAELSEAFFARNDFFPFNREELRKHDPDAFEVLTKVWGATPDGRPSAEPRSPPATPTGSSR